MYLRFLFSKKIYYQEHHFISLKLLLTVERNHKRSFLALKMSNISIYLLLKTETLRGTVESVRFLSNLNKLRGSQYPVAQCSLFKFFLKLLDQWCWRFSEGYLNNFSTELSSQMFDCCPRNILIQEKQNGNVVSTSHWIRPV